MVGPKFAFFHNRIVPIGEAHVSIMTHAFNYGTGVFEGIRGYWNEEQSQLYVFQLQAHYARFLRSCKTLMLNIPYSADELCAITLDLLRREEYKTDVYLRPLAYVASEGIGVRLHDMKYDFALFALPFGKYLDAGGGAKVGVSSWRRIDDNMIPARAKVTGAYVNSGFAKSEAMMNGFDEALVLNQDGHVSEASAANFYMLRDGRAVTPPASDNILEGITREVARDLLRRDMGIEVVERSIDRTELYQADEAFFCGTGVEIVPIIEIDRRAVGEGKTGPVVNRLRHLYNEAVRGKLPQYAHWCTPVYATVVVAPAAAATVDV
ncbi:MAG: branched-chain amino acid transaminase [Chloroflexi bacterium]|nr:branched-chain amino acid transaminase [Chloroflexota bacterium]